MENNIIHIDDLPFELNESETQLLLKKIPESIASIGIQWGFSDSVFRDNLFEHIVTKILHFESIDSYYESDVFKDLESGKLLSNTILLGENKNFKITFNAVFYDEKMNETPEHHGSYNLVSFDMDAAKKNAFVELAKITFKSGYVIKKLEIKDIVEIKLVEIWKEE
jgi:hypothetical protein